MLQRRLEELDFDDLEHKGFVVLKDVLPRDMIEQLTREYGSAASLNRYYALKGASPQATAEIAATVESMLPLLSASGSHHPDTILTMEEEIRGVFFDTVEVTLDWHADFLEAYVLQGGDRFFTFWFPIVKTQHDQSGLDLIPMDRLRAEAPNIAVALHGRGASRVASESLIYEEDGLQKQIPFPMNPNTLAERTHTMPGDLVVFRGDVLHCSQEVGEQRLSYVIRTCHGKSMLQRRVMLTGSIHKHQRMLREPEIFCRLLTTFHLLDRNTVTYSEAQAVAERIRNRETYPRLLCRWYFIAFPVIIAKYRFLGRRNLPSALRRQQSQGGDTGSSIVEKRSLLDDGMFGLRLVRSCGLNLTKYVVGNRF